MKNLIFIFYIFEEEKNVEADAFSRIPFNEIGELKTTKAEGLTVTQSMSQKTNEKLKIKQKYHAKKMKRLKTTQFLKNWMATIRKFMINFLGIFGSQGNFPGTYDW